MTDRELLELVEEGMKVNAPDSPEYIVCAALRARLAQPEPEPVAWMRKNKGHIGFHKVAPSGYVPLYTAPPQREWQGLTDDERTFLAWESNNGPECVAMTEAKLKEKNT